MKTTELPTAVCGNCGIELNATSDVMGDHTPGPGGFTVCIECASVHRFTETLLIRLADEGELAALPTGHRIAIENVQCAIRHLRRCGGGHR